MLTIIGECHLENLGDRDGVLKAKTEMFKNARENADFILNGDDDKLSTVKTVNGKKPVSFGLDAKNDFYAKNIKNSGDGKVLATLCFDNNNIDVEIPAIGTYMVTNALAAAAAGKLLGLTDEEIANGVASYKTVAVVPMLSIQAKSKSLTIATTQIRHLSEHLLTHFPTLTAERLQSSAI